MYNIAVNASQGLYTKTQFKRGDIPTPGTTGIVADAAGGGITKEFVSIKFTSGATRINGQLVTIDADGVATLGTVAEGALVVSGKRAGILTYNASAVATQTMAGTHFGWAQIYGKGKALVTGTATASSAAMVEPAANGAVDDGVVGSASLNLFGLNWAVASTFPPGLADVFINYPKYQNIAG